MDWQNEPFIKRYTRETPEDLLLSWEAHALWDRLLLKVNKLGELALGRAGVPGLAAIVRIPLPVVERALEELLLDGRVQLNQSLVRIPNFADAQAARKSEAQKKRDQRELRSDRERKDCSERSNCVPGNGVRGTELQNLSPHILSSLISSSLISSDDQDLPDVGITSPRTSDTESPRLEVLDGGLSGAMSCPETPANGRRAAQLARHGVKALNELTGRGFVEAASSALENFREILREFPSLSEADVSAVVREKFEQWAADDRMATYLRPGTLFRPENFRRYLHDVGSAPAKPKRNVAVGYVPYDDTRVYDENEEF